jgi:hypothetical protein
LREGRTPLSQLILELLDGSRETITLDEVIGLFGRRAMGALLFVFAVPNLLPLPPGSSSILGAPLVLISPQLAVGVRGPWLPKAWRRRELKTADLKPAVLRFLPWLQKVERVSKPRLLVLFGPIGDRFIGVVCTLLALVLILPIPLGNLMPAFTIGALALALFQRDGVIALVGYASAAASIGLLVISFGTVVLAVQRLAHWIGL